MALLFIKNLKAKTTLGINGFEQAILSDILLDINFEVDITKIAQFDNLNKAIDYDQLAQDTIQWLSSQKTNLLETLAKNLLDFIYSRYPISKIKLSITKLKAINNSTDVTIVVEQNSNLAVS